MEQHLVLLQDQDEVNKNTIAMLTNKLKEAEENGLQDEVSQYASTWES